MYIYIYIHTCTYICICVYMYIYIYIYIHGCRGGGAARDRPQALADLGRGGGLAEGRLQREGRPAEKTTYEVRLAYSKTMKTRS